MRKMVLLHLVVAILLAGLRGSHGLAHEGHSARLPDEQADVIGFRTYLMANIGDNAKELNDKLKAGAVAAAKVNAQAIALHATRIPALFPAGSVSGTSRAKEEIWQQWDDFVKISRLLQDEASQLGVTVANGSAEAASAQARKVFAACKSCHDQFRKPEEKQ
ncbi:MAG: cytochrome c [Candidatus Binatia bacterium]|nr:cytochrome c [Candidatus Binatia bacterium]